MLLRSVKNVALIGATKQKCENRGRCYDDSILEADYCFQPPGLSPIVKLNGMQKSKVLYIGAVPSCIILCREEASPPSPPPSRIGVFGELLDTFIFNRAHPKRGLFIY